MCDGGVAAGVSVGVGVGVDVFFIAVVIQQCVEVVAVAGCMCFKFKVKILVVHASSGCERIGNSCHSFCLCVFVEMCDKPVWHVSLRKRETTRQQVWARGRTPKRHSESSVKQRGRGSQRKAQPKSNSPQTQNLTKDSEKIKNNRTEQQI